MSRLPPLSCWNLLLLAAVLTMCLIVDLNGSWGAESPGSTNVRPFLLRVPSIFLKGPFLQPRYLNIRAGFEISVFAAGLGAPRLMTIGPQGHLYVSVPREGKILALLDENRDGVADRSVVYASGLKRPHGLASHGPDLFVAGPGSLLFLRDENGDGRADVNKIISRDIPGGDGHWTRTLVVGPDEMLYVSAGSSCNACVEADPRRAAVLRFPLAGGRAEVFASGLRNTVGLTFHPRTGQLWGSDNGRDYLGDDLPPEEINRIVKGGDYGWPFCYGRRIPDPDLGSAEVCRDTIPPAVEMQAHSAPLGIVFGTGLNFPKPYREMLYVAYHGSWNRSVPTGYKLVGIPFVEGSPSGPLIDIVSGWQQGAFAWGRPVAPVVGADGALYLSDDRAGAIYRISVGSHGGQGRMKQ